MAESYEVKVHIQITRIIEEGDGIAVKQTMRIPESTSKEVAARGATPHLAYANCLGEGLGKFMDDHFHAPQVPEFPREVK